MRTEEGPRSVSRLLCKIDHVEGCFYAIQSVLQGMDRICSGNVCVHSSMNGKDCMLKLSFSLLGPTALCLLRGLLESTLCRGRLCVSDGGSEWCV